MMKKRNKVLPTVLSTAMIASLVPAPAFADSYVAKAYQGSATVYCDEDEDFDNYQITVSVPVNEDGTIGSFSLLSYDESNASYVKKAMEGKKTAGVVSQLAGKTVSEVLAMSSVDAVSGATCTSNALLTAVQSALSDVETVQPSEPETPSEPDTPSEPETPIDPEPETPGETPSETEAVKKAMNLVSIGGVSYYYVNTKDDKSNTIYQISITSGRGENATTTVTDYKKSDLTQIGSSEYYYTTAPGATRLSGTLYGSEKGSGTATNYSSVYSSLGALTADPAYDCVSSATGFSGYHAKDISSTVTYGTDAEGKKAITGLTIGKEATTVDAVSYVEASILKAAGETLTEAQAATLDIQLKPNPTVAPSTETVQVRGTGSWTTSRYGDGEFAIVPDESQEGYVWSEYWDSVYGATISDGTTTVGAVHWIDLYGEAATSGPHYNKVEIALNNGTSVGANAAEVSRYAAFYDANTGNIKAGTYTITVMADGYSDLVTEVEIPAEEMNSISVGGVTYYYADTTGDAASMVYQVKVTSGRGPSAVTTVYNYTKGDLTQVGDSGLYAIVAPGSTGLEGTLYGYSGGTASNYKTVYGDKTSSLADPAYDCVSSATGFSGYHAKDISSTVTYGTDAAGQKAITGLVLGRGTESVDADTYVTASILKAAGESLTDEQAAALNIQLKPNPTVAPSTETVQVRGTGSWTTSRYGDGEFAIVPDESAEGYVWSEYWDSVYGATISDGTTTVGAVHWIDLYGEAATSGPHYNKVEIALNNGTSVGANAAEVSRYAAFYDEEGNVKPGLYTITIFADGYSDLTVTAEIEGPEEITITDASVEKGSEENVTIICSRSFDLFTGLTMDGQRLTEGTDYTAVSGSTEVTLKGGYVATLTAGTHDLTLLYSDGNDVTTTITVTEKEEDKSDSEEPGKGDTDNDPTEETPSDTPSDDTPSDTPSDGTTSDGTTTGGTTAGGTTSGGSVSAGTSSGGTVSANRVSSTTTSKGTSVGSKAVNTGDTTDTVLWGSMLAFAAAALGMLGFKRKKNR